ncbi:cryptococcal mannosyltransferase 1-domain-containing protein [Phellopilus nigrolimitatus]|nr:cryptococcal mannosyltransferase 1-domain-containing protein [Phellopilus nigrolimitatus]
MAWQHHVQSGISLDQQSVLAGIEHLLTLNGWVVALCPTLPRPFGQSDTRTTSLPVREAVLTLLGAPFRICKVPPMTEDPAAAYYPLEEAHTRNLVLGPLYEFYKKRKVKFHHIIWLEGFTCPNDIFETIMVSQANDAAMVCGMDWAKHIGFFIFSDRWRTRDINDNQFWQARRVFCYESGTHIVDPAQTHYTGLCYRAGAQVTNLSTTDAAPRSQ